MKINKIFLLFLFLLFAFFFVAPKAYASILFQDNFDSGNDNQWTRLSGGSSWRVEGGKYGATVVNGSTIIDSVAGNINTPNYKIDLDMYPIAGIDRNIDFRWINNNTRYEVHFSGDYVTLGGIPGGGLSSNYHIENGSQYHIRVVLNNQQIQFFINGTKLFDTIDPYYSFTVNEQMGLRIGTGAVAPTEVWFDNIVVRTLDDSSANLSVPLLKQTDQLWGSQIYDSADKWSPNHPGVSSWGCAMTSAAMILKFYGIHKLPDGISLDPGSLNLWLKSQLDGYIRNGLLNWLALSRMSKLSKIQNPEFLYDALEYDRKNGFDATVLINDLKNSHPDILEEPGHFIVGKGIDNDVFMINDPFYDRTDLSSYSNSFLSLGRYTPSNTDLSYIMLVADSNIDIVLKDAVGNPLGESFIQSSISNAEFADSGGNPLKILYFKAPPEGDYKIFLSSNNNTLYKLDEYLYDQDGNVYTKTIDGVIEKSKTDNLLLHFNKTVNIGSQSSPEVTFDTVLSDLNAFYNLGFIKRTVHKILFSQILAAKKLDGKYPKAAKEVLREVKEELDEAQKKYKKSIKTEVLNILISDINVLLAKY